MGFPWAAAGIDIGARLLDALLKKKQSRYEMSPQEQEVYDALMGAYRGEVPSAVTAPYYGRKREIEQDYARYPGLSGVKGALIERQALGPMAEAIKSYKLGALQQAGGFVRGTGGMSEPGTDWGATIGEMGGDIAFIMAFMKAMREDEDWWKNPPTYGEIG